MEQVEYLLGSCILELLPPALAASELEDENVNRQQMKWRCKMQSVSDDADGHQFAALVPSPGTSTGASKCTH